VSEARPDVEAAADTLFALLGTGRTIEAPVAERLDMPTAYGIAASIRERREARGERWVGRKIGFTNTTIWPLYGVTAPMWGHVYDTTLGEAGSGFALAGMAEPRIEPEIVFGLRAAPRPGMDEAGLLACIDWIAPGFEIVQSVYPAWRFTLAEATAAFGLHGALLLGGRRSVTDAETLAGFSVTIRRDGVHVADGAASFVLGGPLMALRFLVEALDGTRYPLRAGEVVTTGTLTDAQPAFPGTRWTADFRGLGLPRLELDLE
jgi:2-oxo-3-hexenedioate decarboxylase